MSDKCPWCGEGPVNYTDGDFITYYGCHSRSYADGCRVQAVDCRENERDQLKARIAALEARDERLPDAIAHAMQQGYAGVSPYGFDCPYWSEVYRRAWILGSDTRHTLDSLDRRVAELEAENERLRSRQGADDDALLDDDWLTETLGPKRLIAVENGTLEVMRTSDRDDDPQYVPWFRMSAMSISSDLRSEVKTRGDVRRLVAALGGAEREDGE